MVKQETIPGVDRPVMWTGTPLDQAKAAMIMIHGRGASAQDILTVVPEIDYPNFCYFAPQAPNNTWYPLPFTAPLEANEPHLSASLARVSSLLTHLTRSGIPAERTILFGFSQGACLAVEYLARHPKRYGGVAGLSGGLIGPDDLERDDRGSLEGTPIFLGCSDVDPHIPKYRVQQTADYLSEMGGSVTQRFYPKMGHTINEDELSRVRSLMAAVSSPSEGR